jgi:hypothetical protein
MASGWSTRSHQPETGGADGDLYVHVDSNHGPHSVTGDGDPGYHHVGDSARLHSQERHSLTPHPSERI